MKSCGGRSSRAIPRRCCASSSTPSADEDLPPRLDALERDLAARGLGYRYHRALDQPAQSAIWSLREAALGLSMAMKGDAKSLSFVEDTAVAPERLRDYIDAVPADGSQARHDGRRLRARVGRMPARAAGRQPEDRGGRPPVRSDRLRQRRSGARVRRRAVGRARRRPRPQLRSWRRMFGPALYQAFRHIKQTFDPHGIFNPGKIVDAPPLTANLRYGAGVPTRVQPATFFDYSEHGGLPGAVEMCSGLGACRKTLDGTMCPSYMATREEAHSTRGRANVAAPGDGRTARRSGTRRRGRARGAGSVPRMPRLQGRVSGRRGRRAIQERVSRRLLAPPRHAAPRAHARTHSRRLAVGQPVRARVERRRPQRRRYAGSTSGCSASIGAACRRHGRRGRFDTAVSRASPAGRALAPPRALFNDTFTNYYSPGYRRGGDCRCSRSPGSTSSSRRLACCGRPLISQGLLAAARRQAAASVRPAVSARRARRPDRVPRAQLSVGDREDVPSLLRGDAQRRALNGRRPIGAVRGVPRARVRSRAAAARPRRRARAGRCSTATATRKRWAASRRRRRCSRGFRGRRWSTSMPAAAAWRDRSATRASTSTCRAPSASGGCCPPRARVGDGCGAGRERHVVPAPGRRLHRRARAAASPRNCFARDSR